MLKGRGTVSSPTALLSGDILGSLNFAGYFSSNFGSAFAISAVAASNFNTSLNPVNILFRSVSVSGDITERMRLTDLGNLHIGAFSSDSGERLQVTGTAKITGATSFGGNMTLSTTASDTHYLISTNVTNGFSYIRLRNTATSGREYQIVNNGPTAAVYPNKFVIYDSTAAAPRLVIESSGNIGIGLGSNDATALIDIAASTSARASFRIRSGTAPTSPNDGDIWFDGTNLKMQIGGVTKTFTLL
jgi:hypothetical protein